MFESFAVPRTVAHQALLSMGFPRQEYWNGLPFPSPGDPDPGIELAFPALQTDSLPLSHQESPHIVCIHVCMCMHAQMCTHICLKDVCPGVKACRCICVCVCMSQTHMCLLQRHKESLIETFQLLGLFSTIRNHPCEADFRASPCGTAVLKPLSAVDHFNDNNNS